MKKVLLLAVVALFVMMPLASFSMTTISDSDLNAVTAQEGVYIAFNNTTVTFTGMTVGWGQNNDQSGNFDTGGWVGLAVGAGSVSVNGGLTIDVGVGNSASKTYGGAGLSNTTYLGYNSPTAGGITIGFDSLKVSVTGLKAAVQLASNPAGFGMGSTSAITLGTAYFGGAGLTVTGNLIITTH